jgi:hypothetical protein
VSEQLSFLGPRDTLAEARAELRFATSVGEAVSCPCCGQLCKVYKRGLYATIVAGLVRLVSRWTREPRWYHVNELLAQKGGDFAKLEKWGFIEQASNDDEGKRTSGWWRPTPQGIAFAMGRTTAPRRVYLYLNEVVGWDEARVTVREALGDRFDYSQLMEG